MTPQEINIEIAKFCKLELGTIPNFRGSLDAMAEAEKWLLQNDHGSDYGMKLRRIVMRDITALGYLGGREMLCDLHFYGATAPQRAEAFLRTVGKWRDS